MSGQLPAYRSGPPPRWSVWQIVGVALATVLGLLGLSVIMVYLFVIIVISTSGSNK